MRQTDFVARHEREWRDLERWLATRGPARVGKSVRSAPGDLDDLEFPRQFRRACQHLALARRRGYSPQLLARLGELVRQGHDVLYRSPPPRWRRMAAFVAADFPRLVRRHRWYMLVSAALLYVPMMATLALVLWRPEMAHAVFDGQQLAEFERMYDPANPARALGRESGTDLAMFGNYVLNNVSIGFRTFASGMAACLGAIYVLAMNGVMIGGIAGHLTAIGYGGTFWRFVAGHSGPELTAIVIAGGAGLRLGWALLAPGRLSRSRALLEAGEDGARLVLGVFAMLVVAAFIEAYWSSIAVLPDWLRFGSAAAVWLALGVWLLRGGRGGVDAS